MRDRLLWMAAGIAALGAMAVGALVTFAAPAPGHRPFHFGCLDHSHGPAWHASHRRTLGDAPSRFGRPNEPSGDLLDRRITGER